jgi:hypothetical protein
MGNNAISSANSSPAKTFAMVNQPNSASTSPQMVNIRHTFFCDDVTDRFTQIFFFGYSTVILFKVHNDLVLTTRPIFRVQMRTLVCRRSKYKLSSNNIISASKHCSNNSSSKWLVVLARHSSYRQPLWLNLR